MSTAFKKSAKMGKFGDALTGGVTAGVSGGISGAIGTGIGGLVNEALGINKRQMQRQKEAAKWQMEQQYLYNERAANEAFKRQQEMYERSLS